MCTGCGLLGSDQAACPNFAEVEAIDSGSVDCPAPGGSGIDDYRYNVVLQEAARALVTLSTVRTQLGRDPAVLPALREQ